MIKIIKTDRGDRSVLLEVTNLTEDQMFGNYIQCSTHHNSVNFPKHSRATKDLSCVLVV